MATETTPAVVDLGPGELIVAVVAGIHGDEFSGVHAVRSLLANAPEFQAGVRFVLTNSGALIVNERSLDVDLNRGFPGSPTTDARERRLAASLCEPTANRPTPSLHATHSQPEPMPLVDLREDIAALAAKLPVPNIIDETSAIQGTFTHCSSVVTNDAGCQHSSDGTATPQQ
jgi:predicted deacylase